MQTITVRVNDDIALKKLQQLEARHFITIVEKADIDISSLPAAALSLTAFRNWIGHAEASPVISLEDAKLKWQAKKDNFKKAGKNRSKYATLSGLCICCFIL